jgi:hypothetical protein
MIQRPPACERHERELPGRQRLVDASECPLCWSEQRLVPEDCEHEYATEVGSNGVPFLACHICGHPVF